MRWYVPHLRKVRKKESASNENTSLPKRRPSARERYNYCAEIFNSFKRVFRTLYLSTFPVQNVAEINDFGDFAVWLTFIYHIMFLFIFVYYTNRYTNQFYNDYYLSLNTTAECIPIPLTVSAVYEGDFDGQWESNSSYSPSRSMYEIEFAGSQLNTTGFSSVMEGFITDLIDVNDKAMSRDLYWKLIALSSYSSYDHDAKVHFYSNARAEIIFDQPVSTAIFASANGICGQNTFLSYSKTTSLLTVSVSSDTSVPQNWPTQNPTTAPTKNSPPKPTANPTARPTPESGSGTYYYDDYIPPYNESTFVLPCKGQFDAIQDFKYDPQHDPSKEVLFHFDIRAVTTIIAINFGIANVSSLTPVTTQFSNIYLEEYGDYYTDTFYPNMAPIWCQTKNPTRKPLCLYPYKWSLLYPMINGYYDGCSCQNPTSDDLDCNIFDAIISFLFFSLDREYKILNFADRMQDIILGSKDGDLEVQSLFFPIALQNIDISYNLPAKNQLEMNTFQHYYLREISKDHLFDRICGPEGRDCTVLSMELYNPSFDAFYMINDNDVTLASLYNESITEYGFLKLYEISCQSLLYNPNVHKLKDYPPQTLIERYYSCHLDRNTCIQKAIAMAAGTASLYASILITIVLMTFLYFPDLNHIRIFGYETINFPYFGYIKGPSQKQKDLNQTFKECLIMLKASTLDKDYWGKKYKGAEAHGDSSPTNHDMFNDFLITFGSPADVNLAKQLQVDKEHAQIVQKEAMRRVSTFVRSGKYSLVHVDDSKVHQVEPDLEMEDIDSDANNKEAARFKVVETSPA